MYTQYLGLYMCALSLVQTCTNNYIYFIHSMLVVHEYAYYARSILLCTRATCAHTLATSWGLTSARALSDSFIQRRLAVLIPICSWVYKAAVDCAQTLITNHSVGLASSFVYGIRYIWKSTNCVLVCSPVCHSACSVWYPCEFS